MHMDAAGIERGDRESDIGLDMLDVSVVREEALRRIGDSWVLATENEAKTPIEGEASVGVLRRARKEGRGYDQGTGPRTVSRLRHQDGGARTGPRGVHTRPKKILLGGIVDQPVRV